MRGPTVRLWLSLATALVATHALSADDNAAVIQVGRQSLSVAELRRRWLEIPPFQREALGKTDAERLGAFVDRWVVPELVMSQTGSAMTPISAERRQAIEKLVLERAMAARVRKQSEIDTPVTDGDIKDYLEAHRQDFDRPERFRLARILVATEAEARVLIQKVNGLADFDAWRSLAREKSVDRATSMRGGDLGFVSADGKSDMPELQVDPKLVAAVARLKDGEIAQTPVAEGDKFAVVWRRGHTAAVRATLAAVAPTIRAHLRESRAAAAFDALLADLRAKYVRDVNPDRLAGVDFGQTAADRFEAGTRDAGVRR